MKPDLNIAGRARQFAGCLDDLRADLDHDRGDILAALAGPIADFNAADRAAGDAALAEIARIYS